MLTILCYYKYREQCKESIILLLSNWITYGIGVLKYSQLLNLLTLTTTKQSIILLRGFSLSTIIFQLPTISLIELTY